MKNIWTIFKTDLHNIRTRKAAIIVITALMILPSMYAWFNIIPSWDPYANTEDVAVAIVNEDKGAEVEGKRLNVGDEMVDSLKNNPSLGWQFVTVDEALQGVEYGDYYASIIIPENFTEKLTSVLGDVPEQPVLDYYINEKINAIAPKVTSAGASGIVEKIESGFVKVANEAIFTAFNDIGIELQANRPTIEKFKNAVYQLESDLPEIENLLKQATVDLSLVENVVGHAREGMEKVEGVSGELERVAEKLDGLLVEGNERIQTQLPKLIEDLQIVQTITQDLASYLGQFPHQEQEIEELYEKLTAGTSDIFEGLNHLQELLQLVENIHQKVSEDMTADQLLESLQQELNKMNELKRIIEATIFALENGNDSQVELERLKEMESLDAGTITSLENSIENPAETIANLQQLLTQIEENERVMEAFINNVEQLHGTLGTDIYLQEIERIKNLQDELEQFEGKILQAIEGAKEATSTLGETRVFTEGVIHEMDQSLKETIDFLNETFIPRYEEAHEKATNALLKTNQMLTKTQNYFPKVYTLIDKIGHGVVKGKEGLAYVKELFPEAKDKVVKLAKRIRQLEDKGELDQLIHLLRNDPNVESEFFANPIVLDEHELFPIPNYGSAMAPFFTAMSLWVGGLILVSSLFVDVPNKHRYKSYEAYLGRLLTFWLIGLAQALVVTTGNIFLLKTFVTHKIMFVLFGFLISTAFVIIVYTFVSVFGNTGKVIAIILLVMQLGASGGTFPIQMTPVFFQKIHGFLPFTHALGIFREAVGGIIWSVVWRHIIWLLGYAALFLFIGIKLKERINKSTDQFLEEARESEIIS